VSLHVGTACIAAVSNCMMILLFLGLLPVMVYEMFDYFF